MLKSCINRLEKLHQLDIIQNVYCLAGATNFEKSASVINSFNKVVAGRIVNVYEEQDNALKLFKYVIKKEAIGNVPQFIGQ